MTAFFISRVRVKDPEKMAQYAKSAGQTVIAHGGQPVLRGRLHEVLSGEAPEPHSTGIIQFPDIEALQAWYRSEAYQALIPLREAACSMTLLSYEGLD